MRVFTDLGKAELKSGETMAMGFVLGPDDEYVSAVPSFLGHKNAECQWHIGKCMAETLDCLETRFYLGSIGDEIITSIMTVETDGCGILGHVFTQPNHRRKGACKLLMAEQMEDFRERAGRCLILGTGYDTHPYYIYEGFGFEGIAPESGDMRYSTAGDEAFLAQHFAPSAASAHELAWRHWPMIAVLGSFDWGERLRSVLPPVYGAFNFEGNFYPLKQQCEQRRGVESFVLESESRAVVAFATLRPDGRFAGESFVLDLLIHPAFVERCPELIDAFSMPEAKVQAYADARSEAKVSALTAAGFSPETTLTGQLTANGEPLDVLILSRD
jgi:hypothetical protein